MRSAFGPLNPYMPSIHGTRLTASCLTPYHLCSRRASSSRGIPKCLSGSTESRRPSPFEILGVPHDCTLEDVKTAFRLKVKEYHPDVYKGEKDARAITQSLIEAYEFLSGRVAQGTSERKSFDPFDSPECEAQDVFVYELECIGQGCPYSCVERAPAVFKFAADTGRARASAQAPPDDYQVQLAVGQCPRNCIYYVTPLQREALERVLERALEGTFYSNEVIFIESLLARAKFENGRYAPPKREAKTSTEWVDWY
ncbi:hypothetical protein KP509_25G077100 [Ceratopteris richardii]|uniref:J domain-containing protein n=1 Tax=Ceratopteris richardii TaxID=49495 RepID=A0A8T2RSP2_CERRI|nr:hypothetical protein KP509_25G077100 [Ceratopteris richardii]